MSEVSSPTKKAETTIKEIEIRCPNCRHYFWQKVHDYIINKGNVIYEYECSRCGAKWLA